MQEVVVTGLGIKRSVKSVPYAVQTVSSDQLSTIRQTSVNDALAGKVSGIQVRSQSLGALGRDATIRIRGAGSISDKPPLYVVDGTPLSSSDPGGAGLPGRFASGLDLNMDDVENISVLKGPNATAIYGQRGDAGVILITTKKGRKSKGVGIDLSHSTFFDKVYILPRYQNTYAGGDGSEMLEFKWEAGMPEAWKALDGKKHHDYSDDSSWGPKIEGQEYIPWYAWYPGSQYSYKTAPLTAQPNNIRDFFDTGVTNNTNVAFSKVGDFFSSRLSITNQNTKGITPTTSLNKYIISTQNMINLNSHFTLGANINYVTDKLTGYIDDAYANNTTGSFGSWFHRNLDMKLVKELKTLKSEEGILASWNHNNPGAYLSSPVDFYGANYWYNFYSFQDNINYQLNKRRLYGDVSLTYLLNNKFKIAGFLRKNELNRDYENTGNSILETSATQTGFKSFYETGDIKLTEDNYEVLASYQDKFGILSIETSAGGNMRFDKFTENRAATEDGLQIPNYFVLSNTVTSPYFSRNYRSKKQVNSLYARGSFGFKDMFFVDWSARNDWSSALPKGKNSYFYPSVGGSFVFSELLQESFQPLSFGKIRFGWAQVGSDAAAYSTKLAYSTDLPVGSDLTLFTPNRFPDPNIKPSISSSIEGGIDMRFFKSRIGVSFTYYKESKKDEILPVPITGTTGYTEQLVNVAQVDRDGIELQLSLTPVHTSMFNWDLTLNYAKNNTVIAALAPGITEYVQETGTFGTSSGVRLVHQVGQKWGQLRGGGFSLDANGQRIVDASGRYIAKSNTYFGSVLPDFTGGFLNTFSFGDLSLNVNIDFQKGGKFFSLSDAWGTFSGLTERTAALNDKGKNVRDEVADGGGVHVIAVDKDSKPIDKYVDAYTYFHQFRGRRIAEEHIYDLDFIKMREVSLSYRLPVTKLGMNKWLQSATIALVARNPWLIASKTKDFDASEISNTYGENGQLPSTRSFGFNLRFGF